MAVGSSILGYLGLSSRESKVCREQFPQLWSGFADHVADVGFTGHACASPQQAGVDAPTASVLPAAPSRLVAIGDLHGDLGKARRAFRAAGLTDDKDKWIAGDTVCVQVGDILDRGDAEIRTLYFLESLQAQARAAGGALHVLNGNHETMNVMGNHRYATYGATQEIERWNAWQRVAARFKAHNDYTQSRSGFFGYFSNSLPSTAAAAAADSGSSAGAQQSLPNKHFIRTAAFQPGSTLTRRFFATHPTVLQVGSTVFVHGGVLQQHVDYGVDRINKETSAWMRGESDAPSSTSQQPRPSTHTPPSAPAFLRGADAVVWSRSYSAEDRVRCDCEGLQRVLKALPGAERMVMGHTIQGQGVNAACEGRALRVDVGMSKGCGNGDVEALEILQDGKQVRRIREGWPAEEVPLHGPAAKDTPQAEVKASPEASKGLGAQGAQPPARWWPSFLPPRQPQPVGTAA